MEKQFVSFEIALKLKNKGFNEDCFAFYQKNKNLNKKFKLTNNFWTDEELMGTPKLGEDLIQSWSKSEIDESRSKGEKFEKIVGIAAPIWQQVIDWLKKEYKICIEVIYADYNSKANYNIKWYNGICFCEIPNLSNAINICLEKIL